MPIIRKSSAASSPSTSLSWLMLGSAVVCLSCGALNGNTDLTASVWDALQTWLTGLLSSTWVQVLALIALVSAAWTLAHGGGYRGISVILGILAVALIGPGLVKEAAKANGAVASVTAPMGSFAKPATKL